MNRLPVLGVELSTEESLSLIRGKTSDEHFERLLRTRNSRLLRDIAAVILVAKPSSLFVNTGSESDREYIRRRALDNGEELPTRYERHTVHFDGAKDLARDVANTRILYPGGRRVAMVNTYDRGRGVEELRELFEGVMRGREAFVSFYLYGPRGSPFSLYGVQVTDSAYVTHSEELLYRNAYWDFVEKGEDVEYMLFVHSAGERDERGWSKNTDKRRIYIDVENSTVYSVNTQYAGNTVGLKKLALRLAVYKGYKEGWLAEHMFIVGLKGRGGRLTYFAGAFPAGCGKTSTAMIADTVVGDDLALIHAVNGVAVAVNPEVGMFGIIDGVNPADDPEIYSLLTNPEVEVIFSNVLLTRDGEVWWRGKPEEPREGLNYAGEWWPGKRDEGGKEVPPSHPNARFTLSIRHFPKLDPRIDDPGGVPLSAMVFGGRDSSTLPPVLESFDWNHGVVMMGAALESEKTAAVIGQVGVTELNPYAILDFLPISPGAFTELHFRFAGKLRVTPKIFGVNYFLRGKDGNYLAEKRDKLAWLRWMEARVNGEVGAVKTPVGYVPVYEDLREIFDKHLGKEFPEGLYEEMFSVRVLNYLGKVERVYKAYLEDSDAPPLLFEILRDQERRLKDAGARYGPVISPFKFDKA